MAQFHELTISEVNRETQQAVSIAFNVPANLAETFSFAAGQYITLKKEINGKEVRRAYSLCSTPSSGKLRVAVKEVKDGTFSVLANNKLQVGESLQVHPPEGKFVFEPSGENQKDYIAFAAGSGITPILSIVKTALEGEPKSRFVLVYGNRSVEETIFHKQLLKLQLKYPERFFIEFIYSRKQEEGAKFGRIERSSINYVLRNKFEAHDFSKCYLCGPEAMINTVTEILQENGIAKENILFELFSSDETGEVDDKLEGQSQMKILVDDEEFDFIMPQDTIILDACLDRDIDAPHSCQGGICSSCIARVTSGSAKMRKNQILTDDEIEEGLILTCQAHPTSASVTVNYDEV
ncbi:MAG: ferredoxin--NADP reductase [Leeuwenhoekiella sp.]